MKRLHLHVGVDNIQGSIKFYTSLFGAEPAKVKSDYAKWMLEDPFINFAISTFADKGLDHLGIQVESEGELQKIRFRLESADVSTFDEGETVCCYAKSDKTWVKDTAGIVWEAYTSMQDVDLFSGEEVIQAEQDSAHYTETKGTPDCCQANEQDKQCCG